MASSVGQALGQASTSVTGVAGILMAVPQLAGAYGSKSNPANTIGYQPASTNGVAISPPAIIFNYEGENRVSLESDITDHPVEGNTFIQDQIALKPVIIQTHGFVGELTTALPQGSPLAALQIAANKLTIVPGVAPTFTISAIEAYNSAFQAYQAAQIGANAAVSSFSSVAGALGGTQGGEAVYNGTAIQNANAFANGLGTAPLVSSQGHQQLIFQQFLGYWKQRTLFTVQTPWAVFTSMAILYCRPVQTDESNMVTDFEVSFKQITFATTGPTTQAGSSNIVAASGTKNDYETQAPTTTTLGNLSTSPNAFPYKPTTPGITI